MKITVNLWQIPLILLIMTHYFASNFSALVAQSSHSKEEIAKALGFPLQTLYYFMEGNLEPDLSEMMRIADYFHLSIDCFLRQSLTFKRDTLSQIKLLLLDVDGILTDGGMYVSEKGDQIKKFNAKDGLAIRRLERTGIKVGFISSSSNVGIIQARADMLKVPHVYVGPRPKLEILHEWLQKLSLNASQVAFIGDDLNDLPIMQAVGFSACPSDAARQIREKVDLVLPQKGGEGCVRAFIEDVMQIDLSTLSVDAEKM